MSRRRAGVVTDPPADLLPVLVEQREIAVVPLTVTLDAHSYLDGVDITAAELYDRLAASRGSAGISQPPPGRFAEAHGRRPHEHRQVLRVHRPPPPTRP